MRLTVSAELSAWIADRVVAYPSESPKAPEWLVDLVASAGIMPLYLGWTEVIGLRPDGEVVFWCYDDAIPGKREVDGGHMWLCALVRAAKRYPELRPLLPQRPANAIFCKHFGLSLFADGAVSCPACCGLGWVPDTE